jgi:DNA-binding LytR/AlgR family response regulator
MGGRADLVKQEQEEIAIIEGFLPQQMGDAEAEKAIKELIAELDPSQFWQIHRSTLINARAIAGITRDERGRQLVSIKGRPEKLEVSRSYAHLFKGM